MVSIVPSSPWRPGHAAAAAASGGGVQQQVPTFRALYVEHLQFVWRNLRRLGVPHEQLEDATHDVFVVVHRRLSDFRPEHSPRAWLFAIVRRVASDCRRRVQRKGRPEPLPESLAALDGQGPGEAAARHEASAIVHAFLAELDEGTREAFALAELEQMTAPEIAAAMEIPETTVYARVRSARKALKRFVTQHYPDFPEGLTDG